MTEQKKASIAITGMGCCCATGMDTEEVWNNIKQHKVFCRPVPESHFSTPFSFPVFPIDYNLTLKRIDELCKSGFYTAEIPLNRTLLFTLIAVAEALTSAGLSPNDLKMKRVGIALGTTVGCLFNNEDYFKAWRDQKLPDPRPVDDFIETNLSFFLQKILGVKGPLCVITNACASGTDAIGIATKWLEHNLCDVAIAGGADELSRIAYYGFASLMLTSDEPCMPFDRERKGLNLGEGAGVLFLEKPDNIAHPVGWVKGYGSAGDAYHPTTPHPSGKGLKTAIQMALRDAKITTDDISFINSHGTGTTTNDLTETAALAALNFQEQSCCVVSTKGSTGHTLGAAGGLEAILTLKALRERFTPGTTGCKNPDNKLSFRVLPENSARTLAGNLGISQSLAFGGSNSVLIFEVNKI